MQDIIEINEILRDFHKISGVRISIHDTEFNEIYSYPKEPLRFCKYLQESSGAFLKNCLKSDSAAFAKVKATGKVYVYKCDRGLYEAVAPLYNYGTLTGYLMMGQICDKSVESKEYLVSVAEKIIGNREKANELASTVRTVDRNLISSYINIMTVLAEYLTKTNKVSGTNERLPQLINEYINKNYSSHITLDILSQKFGCCNATLTKSFKKEYNTTIMEALFEVRLKKAEEMIVKSRKSFKEISAECGFYDQNYFSKVFTRKFSCSPSEYRRAKKINK